MVVVHNKLLTHLEEQVEGVQVEVDQTLTEQTEQPILVAVVAVLAKAVALVLQATVEAV